MNTISSIPSILRWQWTCFVLLCALVMVGEFVILWPWWSLAPIAEGLAATMLVLGYEAVTLWRGLPLSLTLSPARRGDWLPTLAGGTSDFANSTIRE